MNLNISTVVPELNDKEKSNLRVIVIFLKLHGRGGVSSVATTLFQAGFFNQNIVIHESSGGEGSFGKLYYALHQLLKFPFRLIRHRPHLLHIHACSGASFFRKIPYVAMGKILGCKILFHVHPSHFLQFQQQSSWFVRKLIHIVICNCDALAFVNSALCSEFRPKYPAKVMFQIPNPINLNIYKAPSQNVIRKKQALFLGAISKNKGVFDIVKAIPIVLHKIPDMKFVFCGDQQIDLLKKEIQNLDLQNAVEVRYWVDFEEKLKLLQTSTVLLLPSYSEGFPIVILEAMACGLPVVSSNVGSIAEAIKDGETGLFITPGNIEMLANRIIELLNNHDLWLKISKKGQIAVKNYDVNNITRQLLNIYKNTANVHK